MKKEADNPFHNHLISVIIHGCFLVSYVQFYFEPRKSHTEQKMSKKFSLKWNDFKTTVSNSLGILREEKDFFDVTLVSDDERQIPAHKLVLSACSDQS